MLDELVEHGFVEHGRDRTPCVQWLFDGEVDGGAARTSVTRECL